MLFSLKRTVLTALCLLCICIAVNGAKAKKPKMKKTAKGIQCYNCMSFDHPGCWDPDHPDYANITIPNIDCYIPGMDFICIVVTAESAKLVETGQEIGPVRARTCVPAKDFPKKTVSYSMCGKLSKELYTSEIFSKIAVTRPQCTLCRSHLCSDAEKC
ncbi:uncharacterized protein LOC121738854 [Aricia agestis]|uniref:uncharacterized protein LOC121738854 n=1 Tax=Aricia agestis TaxID=91739 RepID=UPI001C2019B3|nr:uncharacterized protein LOC121738854 [Aricia agestis]